MVTLTDEQADIVDAALAGESVIVDACWGSGKTTVINTIYKYGQGKKKMLYLTYNTTLKVEARNKLSSTSGNVHNYDAYAYMLMARRGIKYDGRDYSTELALKYLNLIPAGDLDLLLIDEYQDMNEYHSKIITELKRKNPNLQIICVGDINQKIVANSTLHVMKFLNELIPNAKKMQLSQSFRMNNKLAKFWGNIYNKDLIGANTELQISFKKLSDIPKYLESKNVTPSQLMCLGSNTGHRTSLQNALEKKYKEKYNKNTLFATIKDSDHKTFTNDAALFLTYDSCKGLERDYVVLCDFDEYYWGIRAKNGTPYVVLKNLFGVAATRAKKELIVLVDNKHSLISTTTLKEHYDVFSTIESLAVSEIFTYKRVEDINDCLACLKLTPVERTIEPIDIVRNDAYIDLSPCVGTYIEPLFFKNYDMEAMFDLYNDTHNSKIFESDYKGKTLKQQILRLTAAETKQLRYITAKLEIEEEAQTKIIERFSTEFTRDHVNIQKGCACRFPGYVIKGRCDAIKDDTIFEFKFVTQFEPSHFLQLAMYMWMMNYEKGKLWNIRTNEMYNVEILDRNKFKECVEKMLMLRDDIYFTECSKKPYKNFININY